MASFLSLLSLLVWSAIFLFLILFLSRRSQLSSTSKRPPGPPKLPFIGNLHQLGPSLHRSLWQLSKRHGPLMHLQLGAVPSLVVSSPSVAKEVLKTHDLACCGRPQQMGYSRISASFVGVAFAPYGEFWRQMRKLCTLELFSARRVQSFAAIRAQEVAQMVQSISRSCPGEQAVNIGEITMSLANNVVCRAAFGRSYQVGDGTKSRFQQLAEESQVIAATFHLADYFPGTRWADVTAGKFARLRRNFADLNDFYAEVMEEHLDPTRSKPEKDDLVDVLLRVQREDEPGLTGDQIKGILTDIFLAGTDTSSATITWTMTQLMRNKRVLYKAQAEVRRIAGAKRKVEESDLPQLHYLKLVLKEALRLHPPAPLLVPHETNQECTIEGYLIPPKTRIFISAFAIGRDPETWKSPEEFLPERFSESPVDYKGTDFELLPFGAGRRLCPGIYMGMVIVELALANLLYSFDWEVPHGLGEEVLDLDEKIGLTVHKKKPLLLVPTIWMHNHV